MLNDNEKEKLEKLQSLNMSPERILEMQEKIKNKTPLEIHKMIAHSTYDRNTLDLILLQNDLQMYREITSIDLACIKHTSKILSNVKIEKGSFSRCLKVIFVIRGVSIKRKFISIGDKYEIEINDTSKKEIVLAIIVAITNDVNRSQNTSNNSN